MKKVLYFEGAGMSIYEEGSNVGNYRIRTAFLDDEGNSIYLELGGHEFNDKKRSEWRSHIDHVFYIPQNDEEKTYEYPKNDMKGYSKEEITKWVNKTFNTNFDTIEVLHDMEGYRVHGDNGNKNLMDNHILNRKRTEARIKAYNDIDMYFRKKLNEKYSKISLLKMDNDSITIRCYASKESLIRNGLSEADREKIINITY